jgi:hypothetical protein
MPGFDQRVRQVRDHPLRTSVELGRNALIQRGYLGYFQCSSFPRAIKTLRIEEIAAF